MNQSKSKVATMFKRGDRVRLKAWVSDKVFSGSGTSFRQGDVGLVTRAQDGLSGLSEFVGVESNRTKHVDIWHMIAEEDLELMPERQAHVVKDGKVYELRNTDKDRTTFDCPGCAFEFAECSQIPSTAPCENGRYNFQEVKSGKVVS